MNAKATHPLHNKSIRAAQLLSYCAAAAFFIGTLQSQVPPVESPPPQPFPDEPVIATVAFDPTKAVTPRRRNVVFETVGLQPGQLVTITLPYSPSLAGQIVTAEPLDGGQAIVPDGGLKIGLDGNLSFQFQAGELPGLYQVRLHRGSIAVGLQFWVFDNDHLDNGPPVLTPN